MERWSSWALSAVVVLALAGCGGGGGGGGTSGTGGGDLAVEFSYPSSPTALLWEPASITPTTTGLQGHTPQCAVVSGALPAGLTLSGCNITGTAQQVATSAATVRLTVAGFRGHVDANVTVGVAAPFVSSLLHFGDEWPWGRLVSAQAVTVNNFTPRSGDQVRYSLQSGALPAGMSISETGEVTGMSTEAGVATAFVTATVTRGALLYTTAPAQLQVTVLPLRVFYPAVQPVWGVALSASPQTSYSGAGTVFTAAGALPGGLTLDSTTGVVSGVPSELVTPPVITVTQSVTHPNGATASATADLRIAYPTAPYALYPSYAQAQPLNQPLALGTPTLMNHQAGDTVSFSLAADGNQPVPAWLQIDAATGQLYGTPTGAPGDSARFIVNAHYTRAGLTRVHASSFSLYFQ